nr:type II toxin-antitoxin system RelE/ParE family toxin [Kocuria rhizophila]
MRIWVGDHRVIYEILDGELVILVRRIGHRREVYRQIRGVLRAWSA